MPQEIGYLILANSGATVNELLHWLTSYSRPDYPDVYNQGIIWAGEEVEI